jgi:hypothetical protein
MIFNKFQYWPFCPFLKFLHKTKEKMENNIKTDIEEIVLIIWTKILRQDRCLALEFYQRVSELCAFSLSYLAYKIRIYLIYHNCWMFSVVVLG